MEERKFVAYTGPRGEDEFNKALMEELRNWAINNRDKTKGKRKKLIINKKRD